MEPKIVTREAFKVMGVEDSFSFLEENDPGFQKIWMERYMSYDDQVKPLSTDKAYYEVFFKSDEPETPPTRYLAGMAVKDVSNVPEGLIVREIPAARYAVFDTTLAAIGETTDYVDRQWLPASQYELDRPKPHFGLFPPDTASGDSPVTLWIPIREKS